MPGYPPLTPEEQAQLAQLSYQQALADWAAAEAARTAELALFAPLDDCGDLDATLAALDAIDASNVGRDIKDRIGRIRIILNGDMRVLFDRRAALSVARPMPVAPTEPEPEPEPEE